MLYWNRNDEERRWESKCGNWYAHDGWALGRLTQFGWDDSKPAWAEMRFFVRERFDGRVGPLSQAQVIEQALLEENPRYGIPAHVCTCGAKECLSLPEARKRYPLPWGKA